MQEIRAVVNQCGVAIELHRTSQAPVILTIVSVSQMGEYRSELAEQNPNMRHAVIGQLAVGIAHAMFADAAKEKGVTISPQAWTYNASTGEYSKA